MWWEEGLRFTCIGCGRCCRGEPGAIYFTPDEEAAMAAFLATGTEEFRRRFVTGKWRAPSLKEKQGGACVFHNDTSIGCLTNTVRPLQCSLCPFWPVLLASSEAWDEAARTCPGMNSGDLHSAEEIGLAILACPFPDLL